MNLKQSVFARRVQIIASIENGFIHTLIFFPNYRFGSRFKVSVPQIAILSNPDWEIGQRLQYFFFFLNLPQHFDLVFFLPLFEQSMLHPVQADLCANSVIEMLEAKMFDLSVPQKGQTIQVFWRTLPHCEQSSMPRMPLGNLGHPKRFRAPLKWRTFTAVCAEQTFLRLASHHNNGFIANKYV